MHARMFPSDVTSASESDTFSIGVQLAAVLGPGSVVLLFGELGSGKTKFVQGVCGGLNVDEPVVSPTFTIINQYTARTGDGRTFPVYHIDCYRLSSLAELEDIGIEEFLNGDGVCLIEWPEPVLPVVKGEHYTVTIEAGPTDTSRLIHLSKEIK
jgi:tRNA threonylcarbamoyladenosine biosynthesis protein TsaE